MPTRRPATTIGERAPRLPRTAPTTSAMSSKPLDSRTSRIPDPTASGTRSRLRAATANASTTPATAAMSRPTRPTSARRTIAARAALLPAMNVAAPIPMATATGSPIPRASVGSETPTIVASCGSAMRPAVRPATSAGAASSRGRQSPTIPTVTIAKNPITGWTRVADPSARPMTAPRPIRQGSPASFGSSPGLRRRASAATARPRHTSGTTTTVPRASARRANDWLSANAMSAHGPIGASPRRNAVASRWTPAATRIVCGRMNPAIARAPGRFVIVARDPRSPS